MGSFTTRCARSTRSGPPDAVNMAAQPPRMEGGIASAVNTPNVARRTLALAIAGLMLALAPCSAIAGALPEGRKTITLVAADGAKLAIGDVTFASDGEGAKIEVTLDAPEFGDEFLSMRPFRCLAGTKEMWCHLAYPYETKGRVTLGDLADLEYALLFLFKPPAGYGIDAWNGLYFKMMLDGGGGISGALHEADFNLLAVPPDGNNARPIGTLTPVEPDAHRFARVEIR